MTPREIIATHEASHSQVALAVGLQVTRVFANDERGRVRTRYPVHPAPEVQAVFQAKLGIVDLAGAIGEYQFTGETDCVAWRGDFQKAAQRALQVLRLHGALASDEALADGEARISEMLQRWRDQAEKLVAEHWGAIRHIARVLTDRGTLTGAELEQLLDQYLKS